MRLCVVGTGYVGLVAGTCFADSGNDVTCVDIDEGKVRELRNGHIPLYEPGLEELIRRNVRERRLEFSTELTAAVSKAQVIFVAVGTPEAENGHADVRAVLLAAEQIARCVALHAVLVLKSTVPVGTAERVRAILDRHGKAQVEVVSNPEFLKEGSALDDFFRPDRVVIGTESERARGILTELYLPFVRTMKPILYMDNRSAELTKYAANAMLATRISFMNDIAALCERVGADVENVRRGMGADRRIGPSFLFPGLGYGGSCFPKDIKALITTARESGLELELLRAVERINGRQRHELLRKACRHYGDLSGRVFGVWGLAFKPRTDDLREAPSIPLIEGLLGKGARVSCHDPVAAEVAEQRFGNRILYAPTPYDAAEGAEGLFLVTEWNDFRKPDWSRVRSLMREPVVFDGRNLFDPKALKRLGFTYFGIGRG